MVKIKGKGAKSQRGTDQLAGHRPSKNAGGMEEAGDHQQSNPGMTRTRLLHAAAKIFSKKGYDGASVKELSDAAGVNISLVSYHFGGKEGLYRACLKDFGEESLRSTQRILQPAKSFSELEVRVTMLVEFLLDTFVKEPDLSQLAFKEADLETPIVRDIFNNSFLEIYRTIIQFFSGAKAEGLVKDDLDPHTITSLLFGAVSHFARMDKIGARFFSRTIADPKLRENVLYHFKKFFIETLKKD